MVTVSLSIRFMYGQLNYLNQEGYDLTVIASPGQELDKVEREEGVSTYPIKMERYISPLKDIISLIKLVLALIKIRPHITNVGTPKAGLLGGIASWMIRTPYRIYTMHGLRLETTKGLTRLILFISEKITCMCAHKVICVSNSLKDRALELGLLDEKKAVVLGSGSSNGIDLHLYSKTPEVEQEAKRIRRDLSIPENIPIIGFVGRLTYDKGIVELINSYKILKHEYPDLRLLLVGWYENGDPVPESTRIDIENDPDIIITGYVENPGPYYLIMDFLVFLSHREGFPTVPLEAAALEKPVVTTNATGARDAVIDDVTGFIVPIHNSEAVIKAIKNFLDNPDLVTHYGRAGRKRVEIEFKPERIWEEVNRLYKQMIAG